MKPDYLTDGLDPRFNKPFVEHLEDLRSTIIWCIGFLVIGLIAAVPCAPYAIKLASVPIARTGRDPAEFLKIIHIAGGFVLGLRVVFWTGLLFSAPFMLVSIARFIAPGLKEKEQRSIGAGIWSAVLLFAAGAAVCYFVTLPVAVDMMLSFNSWLGLDSTWVETGDYISFVLKLLIAFGAAFQVPVVLMVLGSMGIISSDTLRHYRRHAIVIILIAAMVLTPPDVFTQVLMAVPMIILYEACIWVIYIRERKRIL